MARQRRKCLSRLLHSLWTVERQAKVMAVPYVIRRSEHESSENRFTTSTNSF
jgi:hypothetical protein